MPWCLRFWPTPRTPTHRGFARYQVFIIHSCVFEDELQRHATSSVVGATNLLPVPSAEEEEGVPRVILIGELFVHIFDIFFASNFSNLPYIIKLTCRSSVVYYRWMVSTKSWDNFLGSDAVFRLNFNLVWMATRAQRFGNFLYVWE